MNLENLIKDFEQIQNPEKAKILSRFFKTGKGQYGYGDIFLGITVPQQRLLVKKFFDLNLQDTIKLLQSKIHEHRLTALLILVKKFEKENYERTRENIYNLYLDNTKYINNWDLVDLSAPKIVGNFLLNKNREILYKLAKSKDLWEKRISIISTFTFIRNFEYLDTIEISKVLLNDKHDLIHKSVGWMLREMGKRDINILKNFLDSYYKIMPRTMLRYSIEKLPKDIRTYYLKK
ncbi:DNA alkylation repair protein [Candidatus Dependentiae bacterium]|nr:DNA alkylation repair protein [Candidatus Dependentiae bacterium]MBU4387677.1 DNA alkylation repair protein [Candidatus Dependentiae bacterium]MCG2756619.1 DNA alkylation repair protein [Candidatus Dependentiae bacterium]